MKIELIPVVKIEHNKQSEFRDGLTPYNSNSTFFKLTDITDSNLSKLAIDHTQDLRNGKYDREQSSTFSGGFVLNVDGQDKYFPQCCNELSDIAYWENLANGQPSYNEGHPAPKIEFEDNNIIFNFEVNEFDEPFQPVPMDAILKIDRIELGKAVERTKEQLIVFGKRLQSINETAALNIKDIDKLLIWENANYGE